MSKKVVRVGSDTESGRAVVGPNVSKRKGKGYGTGKLNRQSSRDKPIPHRR